MKTILKILVIAIIVGLIVLVTSVTEHWDKEQQRIKGLETWLKNHKCVVKRAEKPETNEDVDMIEKLKLNERVFGCLEEVEKKCLRKVGTKNCEWFDVNGWFHWGGNDFYGSKAYRIKPDYQPDPQVKDVKKY